MKKKIYIIQPTYRKMDGKKVKGWNQFNHSYNVSIVSGAVPADWEKVTCIEYFEEIDFNSDAEIVLLLCMGYDILYAKEIADKFLNRGKTVIFGSHMDQFSEKLLSGSCDCVFHGTPGLIEMQNMLNDALKGELKNEYEFGMDLNFPFDYSALKGIRMPFIQTFMGMGCRNNCDYCCTAGVYKGNYRMRKVDIVTADLIAISKMNRTVAFNDSNIYNNALYLRRLCREIIRKRIGIKWGGQATIDIGNDDETLALLYESGCRILYIGFESLSGKNLRSISKKYNPEKYAEQVNNIMRHGIRVAGYFMFGFDEDTNETFDRTWKFINEARITLPLLNVLLPVPGTEVYTRLKKENRLLFPDETEFGNTKPLYSVPCHKCYFKPKNISVSCLEIGYLNLYRRVTRIPAIIRRSVSSSPSDSVRFFIMNFALRKEYRKMMSEIKGS
ncbi:MAG: radical SAM protein [Bacteroidetes bacterium]|nr:radical SAM protein [Bacteroidota bacterium]